MDEKWEVDPGSTLLPLLDRIGEGEAIEITHNGAVVGKIVPAPIKKDTVAAKAAVERIRARRKGVTLGPDLTIRQLIDEGRQY